MHRNNNLTTVWIACTTHYIRLLRTSQTRNATKWTRPRRRQLPHLHCQPATDLPLASPASPISLLLHLASCILLEGTVFSALYHLTHPSSRFSMILTQPLKRSRDSALDSDLFTQDQCKVSSHHLGSSGTTPNSQFTHCLMLWAPVETLPIMAFSPRRGARIRNRSRSDTTLPRLGADPGRLLGR